MDRLPLRPLLALTLVSATALALLAGCGGANENSIFDGGTQPHFEGLGTLSGDTFSQAYAVSDDGNVVVGASYGATNHRPFRWTASAGMQALPLLGTNTDGEALAVSRDGSVVAGDDTFFSALTAFRWDAANGTRTIPTGPLTELPQLVKAVSADGTQFFGSAGGALSGLEAFRYRDSDGLVGLGVLFAGPPRGSSAFAASSDGSVVAGSSIYDAGGDPQAFRWTEATGMVGLPFLPGMTGSTGWGISPDGNVIVGTSSPGAPECQATLWDANGAHSLGSLAGRPRTVAFDASSNGTVVVGYASTDCNAAEVAFIWDQAHGMQDLRQVLVNAGLGPQLQGWQLLAAFSVTPDGSVIVGYGVNPQGQQEAWRVTIR